MPAKRSNQYEIDGLHGLLDYGNETYENRTIDIQICIYGATDHADLRKRIRKVALWLSGTGNLVFDDEPDKAYTAKILTQVDLSQLLTVGICDISFTCKPFAQTPNFIQKNETITTKNKEISITSEGSQNTPAVIIIKNNGTNTIQNIELIRKAEN